MSMLWTNNASSVLASDITAGTLSITVTTGHGDRFPEVVAPDYFMATLVDTSGNREIVKVTARTAGSNTMTITRAQESTSARSFATGDIVELRITKNAMDKFSKSADIHENHYVCDASAADQGAATNSSSLKSLVDSLGATEEATIELPHTGTGDTTTYTVGTDLTIPATVTLRVHKGARISPSSGKTLTVNGIVQAGAYQIFAGDGTVTVSTYPQDQAWWGSTQQLDVTGLKVGAAIISAFIKTLLDDADAATARGTLGVENIPATTKMWFYQDAAPTGWTIDATPADALLAVKGGSNAFNAAGGTQAGTWTQPNHTHTTGDVTLSAAQSGLPAHTHAMGLDGNTASNTSTYFTMGHTTFNSVSQVTGAVTGGAAAASAAHNHGTTGNGATANTWRPLAQLGIICTKN